MLMATDLQTATLPPALRWIVDDFADAVPDPDDDCDFLEAHAAAALAAKFGERVTLTMSRKAWSYLVDELDFFSERDPRCATEDDQKKLDLAKAVERCAIEMLVAKLGVERLPGANEEAERDHIFPTTRNPASAEVSSPACVLLPLVASERWLWCKDKN
jgi:hypothetical protein